MKALKISLVGASLFFAAIGLSSCTNLSNRAETTLPATEEATSPEATYPSSEDIFENQEKTLKQGGRPLEIRQQVRAKGSTTINVVPIPDNYTQLGVAVQCAGNSQWSTRFVGDGLESKGDCSLTPGSASLVDATQKDRGYTVEIEVLDEQDTPLWVIIYATSGVGSE